MQNTQSEIINDITEKRQLAKNHLDAKLDMHDIKAHVARVYELRNSVHKLQFNDFMVNAIDNGALQSCVEFFFTLGNTNGAFLRGLRTQEKDKLYESFMETAFYQLIESLNGDWTTYENLKAYYEDGRDS
jgi:hypothetical protein